MKRAALLMLGLGLAGCNPATQATVTPAAQPVAAAPAAPAPASAPIVATGPVNDMQNLPPIYEPLVDTEGVNPAKYQRDLAACRKLAAPQEKAAREAMDREKAGTAIAVAGAMAGFLPVKSFTGLNNRDLASGVAQGVGANIAQEGAITGAQATADYALVVNNCLTKRRYVILR